MSESRYSRGGCVGCGEQGENSRGLRRNLSNRNAVSSATCGCSESSAGAALPHCRAGAWVVSLAPAGKTSSEIVAEITESWRNARRVGQRVTCALRQCRRNRQLVGLTIGLARGLIVP